MRAALLTAIVIGTATLAGCSGSSEPTEARPTAPVIAPGRPGEQARTLSPTETVPAVPSPSANAADVLFMQDMIVHHRQALDMSDLAPTRAASDAVKRMAARINDAQGPEISAMTRWLEQQGQRLPDHHELEHHDMPGMATPEQLDALRKAGGADFDRLFVQLMIAHHMGAITMAADEMEKGSHVTVQELAQDISVTQTAEINRLRQLQP
ncbi:DUF305 domain-containing protein [Planotetraspora phitsanulokensis]|uniref:Lipoprotein n=1 Tax=Planotetraspora phitsanulokensis TaxID=575192 RepID=A0A8J3U1P9_9ACTN|nr:DUF305 domain-containing protein [Planotetraspora phitsanulokensis]GII36928.1 lipoprotein [Planotetraspora phitsanulokensis]